jgi:hypothetical protein
VADCAGVEALDEPSPELFPPPHAVRSRATKIPSTVVRNERSSHMIASLLDNADIDAGGRSQRKISMAGERA